MELAPFDEDDEYPDYAKEEEIDPPEDEDYHLWVQTWDDDESIPKEFLSSSDLLAVLEVSRHGARAPGKLYPFNADHWYEVELDELTGVGMRQHYLLGAEFRQRLIVDQQLLSPTFNETEIEVWSTDSNRTLSSAYCQLLGLYPPGTGFQVSGKPAPPIQINDLSRIEASLGSAALPFSWQVLPIKSQPTLSDFILKGYSSEVCPILQKLENDVINSDYYQSKQSNLNMTLFRQVSQALGVSVKTIKQAAAISTAIECDLAAGYPLVIAPDLFSQLQSVHAFYRYTLPFQNKCALKLSFSAFLIEVCKRFDEALAGTGPKFTFFSGHDSMLSGLLMLFQWPQDRVPPFASTILFQLFANQTVLVTYNDEVIPDHPCANPPCPYAEFKEYVGNYTYPDYQARCQETEASCKD